MRQASSVRSVGLCAAALAFCALSVSCRLSPTGTLIGPAVGSQPWWLVRSEHFTVRSDVGDTETREIAIDLERTYRMLFDLGFPLEKDPALLTDVVIFRRPDDYKQIGPKGSGGYYTPELASWALGRPTFLTYGGISEAARPTFVHELTHRFIHHVFPQAPIWLNEGLADYYQTIAVDGGKAVLGRSSHVFKRGDSWTMGRYGIPIDALPPIDVLMGMDAKAFYAARTAPESGEGKEPDKEAEKDAQRRQTANYASAWAMVHAFKNGTPENRARFDRWLQKMAAGESAQAAFDSVFHEVSLDQLDAARRAVLEQHVIGEIALLRTDYEVEGAPPRENRAMRPAEVDLMWGWILRKSGRAGEPEVRRHAEAALKAEPSSVEAHLLMASVHLDELHAAKAEVEVLEAARIAPDDEVAALALFQFQSHPPRGVARTAERRALAEGTLKAWLPRARLSTTLNDFAWHMAVRGRAEEAVPIARRATQIDPSCAGCFDTVGVALARSGQYRTAIEVEELAAGLAGEGRGASRYLELADLYRAVNSAVVLWKKRPEPGTDPSLLPISVVNAVVAAQRPLVLDCYRQGLRSQPTLRGAVVVRGEIGKDGRVTGAVALPAEAWEALPDKPAVAPLVDEDVVDCIVAQVASTRFPESSAPSTLMAPFVLDLPSRKE